MKGTYLSFSYTLPHKQGILFAFTSKNAETSSPFNSVHTFAKPICFTTPKALYLQYFHQF